MSASARPLPTFFYRMTGPTDQKEQLTGFPLVSLRDTQCRKARGLRTYLTQHFFYLVKKQVKNTLSSIEIETLLCLYRLLYWLDCNCSCAAYNNQECTDTKLLMTAEGDRKDRDWQSNYIFTYNFYVHNCIVHTMYTWNFFLQFFKLEMKMKINAAREPVRTENLQKLQGRMIG